jgi:putative tryptophan/tyrosine transport system substrate-binding protein
MPFDRLRRREFITLLGGAAVVWPLTARAQDRVRRIGMLSSYAEADSEVQVWKGVFISRLRELGWVVGRNIQIEYRWSAGDLTVMQTFAKELVASQLDAIVASNTPPTAALLCETHTIPIVFATVTDPIGSGFVKSVARPGGNATGFFALDSAMGGKWLEMLREIAPQLTRAALIFNPETATYAHYFSDPFEIAARASAVQPIRVAVRDSDELKVAVNALAGEGNVGLVAMPDTFTTRHRDLIIALAAVHRLPAIYPFRFMAVSGGLLSYGADETEGYRNTASYVDRILRGEKASELPVQLPAKLQLVINFKTAKALGIEMPTTLIARADEVIE